MYFMQKRAVVAILLSYKIDIRFSKDYKRQGIIFFKSSRQQEDIAIIKLYRPNKRAPKHMKQNTIYKKLKMDQNPKCKS